jgi:hypothetical protein
VIITDPHGRDHILCLLGRFCLSDHQHHLWWYDTAQGVKHHHLILLISMAIFDDASESSRLQLHIHLKRPIGVIDLSDDSVATSTAHLTNHLLDHHSVFGDVVVGFLPRHFHKD